MGTGLMTNSILLILWCLILFLLQSNFRWLQNILDLQYGAYLTLLKRAIREYIDIMLIHLKYVISITIRIHYIMLNYYNFIVNTFIYNGNNYQKLFLEWFLMSLCQLEIFTRNYNSHLKKGPALFCFLVYQIYYNQQLIVSKQFN